MKMSNNDATDLEKLISRLFPNAAERARARETLREIEAERNPPQPDAEALARQLGDTPVERNRALETLKRCDYQAIVDYNRGMDKLESQSIVLARVVEAFSLDELKAFRIGMQALAATFELLALCAAAKRAPNEEAYRLADGLEQCERAFRPLIPARDAAVRVLLRVALTDAKLREVFDECWDEIFVRRVETAVLEAEP
jgi:hypothetical protein